MQITNNIIFIIIFQSSLLISSSLSVLFILKWDYMLSLWSNDSLLFSYNVPNVPSLSMLLQLNREGVGISRERANLH